MSDEGRTVRRGGHQIIEHYCEFDGCNEWGCYGFEESRTSRAGSAPTTSPAFIAACLGTVRQGAAAEIADMLT